MPKTITPDDINNMTAEEFDKYLDELDRSDRYPDEPEETPEDTPEDIPEETTEDTADEAEKEAEDVPEDTQDTKPEETPPPFRTFGTEQEFNAEVDGRINAALEKERNARKPQDETVSRLSNMARHYYKDSQDPLRDMADYMEKTAAERDGVNIDELRRRADDERDARAYRDMQKQQKEQYDRNRKIIDTWLRDSEQLKVFYPDFDFKTAMENPAFKNEILGGKTVAQAYKAITTPPEEPERKPIMQNAQEAQPGTGSSSFNPASLDSADFMKYINRLKEA